MLPLRWRKSWVSQHWAVIAGNRHLNTFISLSSNYQKSECEETSAFTHLKQLSSDCVANPSLNSPWSFQFMFSPHRITLILCQCSCYNLEKNFFSSALACFSLWLSWLEILWLPLIFAKLHLFIPLLVKRNVDLSWSVWVMGRGLLANWCLLAAVSLGGNHICASAVFCALLLVVQLILLSSLCGFSRTSGGCPVHTVEAAKQDLGRGWFSLFSEKILWREKMCKSTKKM